MDPIRAKTARTVLAVLSIIALGLIAAGWLVGRGSGSTPDSTGAASPEPSVSLREVLSHPDIIPSHRHPLLGQKAPDFTLTTSDGHSQTLLELQDGRPLVLVFTYGPACKNCRRELNAIDRQRTLFSELDARVAAISPDTSDQTAAPMNEFGSVGFPLLLDPENRTAQSYRVWRGNSPRHGTFVLDRAGVVRWTNVGDAPFQRVSALLTQVALIEGRLPATR